MTLGESIRNLRKQHNLSQEQLAEKLDVSRQSVSLWEKDSTQPTIDNIITLSDIFGVTVDELLKSNEPVKIESDSSVGVGALDDPPETNHKAKRFIIAALDLAVFAVGIYLTWYCATGTQDFFNVMDLHFSGGAVLFLEISPIITGALSALWLLTALLVFVKQKPFKVTKTILIMLGIMMFVAVNIVGGVIDNSREKEAQDTIPQGVSYLDLKTFEEIETSSEYEEQYVEGRTDAEIPANYSVSQEYLESSTYTECVEFTDNDLRQSELSRYFLELEVKDNENDKNKENRYFTDEECDALGIEKGEYFINKEGKWFSFIIVKGSRVYYCYCYIISEINENTVKEQIRTLQ